MTWDEAKRRLEQRDGVKEEIGKCELEFKMLDEFITAMAEQNISQDELKEKIGTNQDIVSDIESGLFHTAMELIQKIGDAIGKKPVVKFV